jgi:geranylgeranyl reductase
MDNRYDVIIIGAGPGGLECAYQLNGSYLTVLLIEKNAVIGPKVCAGGLTRQASGFSIPEDKARSFPRNEVFFKEKKHVVILVNPLRTISRFDLGQYQLQRIQNSPNIRILKGTRVKAVDGNTVNTDKGVFQFKYLVGADGSTSIVRKSLGCRSEFCIGLYYDIPEVTDRLIWYVNPELLGSGYIWVFPHRYYTNAGVYFNPKYLSARKARDILRRYLRKNDFEFFEDSFRGAPVNYLYNGCVFGNIFLVGDAAGLVSKATGEGISFAMISGSEVGKKVLNPGYRMDGLKRALSFKRRHERPLKILERSPSLQGISIKTFICLMKTGWFQSYFGN